MVSQRGMYVSELYSKIAAINDRGFGFVLGRGLVCDRDKHATFYCVTELKARDSAYGTRYK